jgi:4-amino-4-deoxy-L-arabinose transferase-like glycosyltransferase
MFRNSFLDFKTMKPVTLFLLSAGLVAVIALRFVHLEADFPRGITWSAVLYSDEGWYTYAAVSHQLTGQWYVEGDYNPAIHLPVFYLIQAVTFKLLGISLFSARFTVAIFSVLMILSTFLLVRRFNDLPMAFLCAFLLSINFMTFGYSRLAILEVPLTAMLVMILLVVLFWQTKRLVLRSIVVAILFFIAILTKPTAAIFLPVILVGLWMTPATKKERVYFCLLFLFLSSVLWFSYNTAARQMSQPDWVVFHNKNIVAKINPAPMFFLRDIPYTVWHGWRLDRIMLPLVLLFAPIFLWKSKPFRESKLALLSFLWVFSLLSFLCTSKYQPERYYVPLIVPLTILFSNMFFLIWRKRSATPWARLVVVLPLVILIENAVPLMLYIKSPQYSFLYMARDMGKRARQENPGEKIMFLGDFANSVSLVTQIPSINAMRGTRDLDWKLARYKPNYLIFLGRRGNPLEVEEVETPYEATELANYNVFENYYHNQKVIFLRLSLPK